MKQIVVVALSGTDEKDDSRQDSQVPQFEEMTSGQEAIEKLSQELVGGHDLNARLLAMLRRGPLDGRGQEAAVAMSQELSRVFMVSLFMLRSGDSSRVAAPGATIAEGGIDQPTPTNDIPICGGEEVTPTRKGRQNGVTCKEITASPHSDGYQWRKYGQKNIQNRKFARCYYKCMFSHDRGCRAKKTVQQQDTSGGRRPMFQVTYVNEHKCQQEVVLPRESIGGNKHTTRSGHFDPQRAKLDDDVMASCLAMVIGGAAPAGLSSSSSPPPVVRASPSDPVGGRTPTLLDVSMGLDETTVAEILCRSPFAPVKAPAAPSSSSSSLPVEAINLSDPMRAGGGLPRSTDAMSMDEIYFPCGPLFSPFAAQSTIHSVDVPTAVARFTDTDSAWPYYL
ncbi:transcription factor WRKY45-2-like [Triticum urartu]|uniref:transcription factor WRKY45-2-like n=1 Tax=Triticum urartu TaxID=4572 RepID=UPI002044B9A7|nr:transcription factor WRKY45-2-like [Triticum urartu]